METLQAVTRTEPLSRRVVTRTYGGLETGQWQSPKPASFQPRAANDDVRIQQVQGDTVPPWMMILGGAIMAAVIGALLGGALHI